MIQRALAYGALFALPLVSFAQTLNLSPLGSLIGAFARLIGALVPILITLALVVFFWGLVKYLWGHGGKADIEGAKKLMRWGLITLFVMVSVWGIIGLMQDALNINKNATGKAPQIQYNGGTSAPAQTWDI